MLQKKFIREICSVVINPYLISTMRGGNPSHILFDLLNGLMFLFVWLLHVLLNKTI